MAVTAFLYPMGISVTIWSHLLSSDTKEKEEQLLISPSTHWSFWWRKHGVPRAYAFILSWYSTQWSWETGSLDVSTVSLMGPWLSGGSWRYFLWHGGLQVWAWGQMVPTPLSFPLHQMWVERGDRLLQDLPVRARWAEWVMKRKTLAFLMSISQRKFKQWVAGREVTNSHDYWRTESPSKRCYFLTVSAFLFFWDDSVLLEMWRINNSFYGQWTRLNFQENSCQDQSVFTLSVKLPNNLCKHQFGMCSLHCF